MIPPPKPKMYRPCILVACECSGIVRDAFEAAGWDAWSCDIKKSENGGKHHIGDAFEFMNSRDWDMLIAHPPCTRLCNSGIQWLTSPPKGKTLEEIWKELDEGAELFSKFLNSKIKRVAIENPIMHYHVKKKIRNFIEPAQLIQPWQFGHGETKGTYLWLKNIPPLSPTNIVDGRESRIHNMRPGKDRSTERSRTYTGIAKAMAEQWSWPLLKNFMSQSNLFTP